MTPEQITTHFDYHYGMWERVWACVERLSPEQFMDDNGYSLGSARNHLVHCFNVDDRWMARLKLVEPPPVLDENDFADHAAVRREWQAVRERVLAYVGSLSQADLDERIAVSIAGRTAQPQRASRSEILLHVVNHGTDHRAQLLARLNELGAPTLEQDLILHLWSGA